MEFKKGDRIKVIGRPEWEERGWSTWTILRGKTGIVKAVSFSNITIYVHGKQYNLMPESLELIREGQLLFGFMYDA